MDRSLTHLILFCLASACSAGGTKEPCAPAPTPAPAHPTDLVDSTEKEAVPVKPPSDDAPSPAPATPVAPAAPAGNRAECVIPEKSCASPEACPGLEELCHTLGDPIARNDTEAFLKVVASGSGSTFGIDEKQPEKAKETLEKKGGPRSAFGFPANGGVKVTLVRDCTPCRRSFVSFSIEVGAVKGMVMVDGNQITSWAKGK